MLTLTWNNIQRASPIPNYRQGREREHMFQVGCLVANNSSEGREHMFQVECLWYTSAEERMDVPGRRMRRAGRYTVYCIQGESICSRSKDAERCAVSTEGEKREQMFQVGGM